MTGSEDWSGTEHVPVNLYRGAAVLLAVVLTVVGWHMDVPIEFSGLVGLSCAGLWTAWTYRVRYGGAAA